MPLKKLCRKCDTEKPITEFGQDKARHDGVQYQCRECRLAHRRKNNERTKALKLAHYYKYKDQILEKKRAEYKENKEKKLAYQKAYAEKNRDRLKDKSKQFYANRPDYYKNLRKMNPEKVRAKESKRRCAKLQRTPKWVTPDDYWMIQQAYDLAAIRTKVFGFAWHVDHIVPLQAKIASGLHVPENLQVIPASINMSKQNRFEV